MESNNNITMDNNAEPRVIISLTTYPGRIERVHITIESLIRQTVPADMIVLWLASEQFPEGEESLPPQLLALRDRGLHIDWCDDIRSYKKLIPSAEKYPEDIIITADDDLIYEINTVERLLESYKKHPDCVSALRTHLMLFDSEGNPQPYSMWKSEYSGLLDKPLMALFPTTGAGILFPPGILPPETFDRETFMSICPMADDIWVKCMLTIAGVPVVLADVNTKLQLVEGTQSETLFSYNRSGNDDQLNAVINKYNAIGGEERPEDTLLARMNDIPDYIADDKLCQKYRKNRSFVNEKTGVFVSVIIVADNNEKLLRRSLTALQAQTINEVEFICVNNGSTDGTAEVLDGFAAQDNRIRIITLPERLDPAAARRAAVLESRGEYCLFPDIRGVLAPDACQQLYALAEENDADIFAFTTGILNSRTGEADPHFAGSKERLRGKNIVFTEFGANGSSDARLSSCVFGGRIARKAYLHAENPPVGGEMYDFFLLCRASEVYEGKDTNIFYACPPAAHDNPETTASAVKAIEDYLDIAQLGELFGETVSNHKIKSARTDIERWLALPCSERANGFSAIKEAWPDPVMAAAISMLIRNSGYAVLNELSACLPEIADRPIEHVGIAVTDPLSARELFTMTELLDCVAAGRKTTLIGADKSSTSNAVLSAKTNYAGADLTSPEAQNEYTFACRFSSVLAEEGVDAVVLWAGDINFTLMALLARMNGLPAVAAMTEAAYTPMCDCSVPAAGISALRLAAVTVTDSPAQQRLLDAAGLPVRFIPRPALRAMGGRNQVRASANAIVWTGEPDSTRSGLHDALEIFRLVRRSCPSARMLMYLDGVEELENVIPDLPAGVELHRLRPDYGIFSDAVIQLVTGTAGITSGALRAGRTLGVPAVMYRYADEQDSGAGAVTVHKGDCAAAAAEIIRLLEDKKRREHLGEQGKISTGACDREEVTRRWGELLDELPAYARRGVKLPEDELGRTLSAAFSAYEDGAVLNAARLAEYDRRCLDYERLLAEAEERRVKEVTRLEENLDRTKNQLKEKERARSLTAAQLEDLRGSTLYKVGDIITRIPRFFKKLLASLKNGNSEE